MAAYPSMCCCLPTQAEAVETEIKAIEAVEQAAVGASVPARQTWTALPTCWPYSPRIAMN